MTIGERLRSERERLGLSQPNFAATVGTTKQTLFSWETGKTAPDGFQLAALGAIGVDVLYVVSGERDPAAPALDVSERVLIDNYRRCNGEAKAHLVQTAALLAAGIAAPEQPVRRKQPTPSAAVNMRNMTMTSNSPGSVQVGYAGGKVSVKGKGG
ncbi:helix-turn-helix domain-containing protein [Acidovorax sp. NCPPB 3576]|uniref:helix-turn-helix domain-containing protein n=1 Tax=Acidovorax sp. NCPPB 3576 TaxID=2940488 RepID=UPI002349207A|nr:helix-turn-helix domain-containing protein [Acidovorax sp. NCPPB 3576]WCM88548.1 helix-turn-helix domain-containing protein [Acidovorax sp. NCPPB 3576]